jgi:hypothetical protein
MFPSELPDQAAWQHRPTRAGFETTFFQRRDGGHRVEGRTSAVEDGRAWAIDYSIEVDARWRTTRAEVRARSRDGERHTRLELDDAGRWHVDGVEVPELDGCLDVDLEASACTNTFPVHRLALAVGDAADAPAAWVRAADLRVERLEQHYTRLDDHGGRPVFAYVAPDLDFSCQIAFDGSGLVLDYPEIATRFL